MSLGVALLLVPLMIAVIGALFGVVAWRASRRRGPLPLVALWAATALVLGALGALRVRAVQHELGFASEYHHSTWTAFLFMSTLAIALAPTALALRARAQLQPRSTNASVAVASAGWSLVGLFLAVLIALVLDLSNVAFVPGMSRSSFARP